MLPGTISNSIEDLLNAYQYKDPLIAKIVLSLDVRAEAMQALYRMNISSATLFPDLDGLARFISYELEVSWVGSSGRPK